MTPALLVRTIRDQAGLSIRAMADAAGVAPSTVHRIERGDLHPTVTILERLAEAGGMRLHLDAEVDYAAGLVGLARCVAEASTTGPTPVRMAAELVRRYRASDPATRSRMTAADPPTTGDSRWDAFLGALAEWLAVTTGDEVPAWVHRPTRFLDAGWWITSMGSMRAWEYAGSPASFKIRGVYLHRDSLENV